MNIQTALNHLKGTAWVRPSNYVGTDWTGYFIIVSQNRDSDCLEKVNAAETWNRYTGERERVQIAKRLGLPFPNLATRWTFQTVNEKTDGRLMEHLLHG